MTIIILIKGIESPVGASKRSTLRPLFLINPFSKSTFSKDLKQGWVVLLVLDNSISKLFKIMQLKS